MDNPYAICQENFVGSRGMVQVYRNWENAHCLLVVWRLKKKLLDRSLSFILIGIILCPLHALYNITSEFLHAKTVRMHLYIIMWYSAKCLGTRSAQLHHHSSASLLIVSFSAELISSVREQGILALGQTCSQQA